MNNQNILTFFGSKLDIKLDSSEYYDFELSNVDNDYDNSILDLETPITYNTLKIDETLENFVTNRSTITLTEIDYSVNDSNYVYSGLQFTLSYYEFTSHFDNSGYTSYSNIILNNDIYTFNGVENEPHYFRITSFNDPSYIDTNFSGLDEDEIILLFSTEIIYCYNKLIDGYCCPITDKLNNKPWAYIFSTGATNNSCEQIIENRPEKGWTLDFIFNRNSLEWVFGGVFYYIGVRGDDNIRNYADNNLSFGFTDDGRIKWSKIHYSGACDTLSGFTETYTLTQGFTPVICVTGNTKDFNITIVFKRYREYEGCDLLNEGGINDLISGATLTNGELNVMTGATPNYLYVQSLNKKWTDNRKHRLGVLKIYLNGYLISKFENFEEIIPSNRGVQPFIQSWGGGTPLMDSVHEGFCDFNIKKIKYYDEPLTFPQVKHNFNYIYDNYDFEMCNQNCVDNITGIGATDVGYLITQNNIYIITQNGNRIRIN